MNQISDLLYHTVFPQSIYQIIDWWCYKLDGSATSPVKQAIHQSVNYSINQSINHFLETVPAADITPGGDATNNSDVNGVAPDIPQLEGPITPSPEPDMNSNNNANDERVQKRILLQDHIWSS